MCKSPSCAFPPWRSGAPSDLAHERALNGQLRMVLQGDVDTLSSSDVELTSIDYLAKDAYEAIAMSGWGDPIAQTRTLDQMFVGKRLDAVLFWGATEVARVSLLAAPTAKMVTMAVSNAFWLRKMGMTHQGAPLYAPPK